MSCPICRKRKPKRFCPAKDEKICAVCCGTEREVTIDCPTDCPHLVAARRWDSEHRQRRLDALPAQEIPYADFVLSEDAVNERQAAVFGLGLTVLRFAKAEPALVDTDALEALAALAESYRTLAAGVVYEQPPAGAVARELYGKLAAFLEDYKQHEAEHAGFAAPKDSDMFQLLVFLLRVGRLHTNGRPRSRAFLDFLRANYPPEVAADLTAAGPRIITP